MSSKIRLALGVFVVAVLAILALPGVLRAQSSNGTLVGAVTDPTGAAVAGADVKVVSTQYGAPHEATTDSVGTYRIENLQPGTYSVTFTATGFSVLQVAQVQIQGSLTTTTNGPLQLGTASASITVEAGANQIIDTQSGQLGESLGETEVENLPYTSFNPAELAMTLPGVHDVPGYVGNGAVTAYDTNGFAFSVNGTRPRSNNFLIDGQDDNDSSITGQAYQPDNVGLIAEVSILENSYSAQYGFGGGSVTNYITKSGSNAYHGSLWEINQDSAFASNDAANKHVGIPLPLYIQNTYGVELGGRVIRDKLFFYGTAQWDPSRQRGVGATAAIPDANGTATLTTLGATNTRAEDFLKSMGGLVAPGSHACGTGTYDEEPGGSLPCVEMSLYARNAVPIVGTDDNWFIKGDYHPTENDQITGAYLHSYSSLSPDFFANNSALAPFDTYQGGPAQIFRGHWAHTLSPTLLNEARFSYTDINFAFGLLPSTAANPLASLPYLEFPTAAIPNIGISSTYPQGRGHKTYEFQEMVTKNFGNHTITAGVDIDRLDALDILPLNTRGTIEYFDGGGFDAFGNFLEDYTGTSGQISKGFGNPNLTPNSTLLAPYVQDAWRVKDNLTLSLGLRYEYWGTPENVLKYPSISPAYGITAGGNFNIAGVPASAFPNLYATKEQGDRNNFAPRISFAYTPRWGKKMFGDSATVLRGGYGIFYDGLFTNIPDNAAETQPNAPGGSIVGGSGQGQANALETLATITSTLNPHGLAETISSKLVNPVTQQWNLDIQRALPGAFVLTASYVGTRGTHLFANQDWNPTIFYGPRYNPNFNEIAVRTNAAQSWYNSGQLELEHKAGHGLTLRAAYTYSKYLDDASDIFTIAGLTSYAQDLACQKCDWGPSIFDRRHRFTMAYVYELPSAKGNWIERALTDKWQWAGIATFQTGSPNNVLVGSDNIGNGHSGSRPNVSNPHQPITAMGVDSGWFTTGVNTGVYYAYTSACINSGGVTTGPNPPCTVEPASSFRFIVPASGPGNLGRNSQFGPGQVTFDTSIERDFPFHIGGWEHQSIAFRTEFFNAFNHPNLYTPSYVMTSSSYDQVGDTIEGQRIIKFWLRYSF